MDTHIRHLHCRYRIHGERTTVPLVARRLERVARDGLAQAYEAALGQRCGSDRTVVVLRNVRSRISLPLQEVLSDTELARRWGERLAANVIRRVAEAGPGDSELVRFEDQADYVSRFLADQLERQAWDRWYYGAFHYVRGMPLNEAVSVVLLDNREHLGEVLVLLSRRGVLGKLINRVDAATLRTLWFSGLRGRSKSLTAAVAHHAGNALDILKSLVTAGRLRWPERLDETFLQELARALGELPWLDGEGISSALVEYFSMRGSSHAFATVDGADKDRALFDQACRLIDELDLWSEDRRSREGLFAAYRPRVITDWRDSRALGQAVADILRFFFASGQLHSFGGPLPSELLPRLEQVLATYDWLDIPQLRTRLLGLLMGGGADRRPMPGPMLTPRQRALLDELPAVIATAGRNPPGLHDAEAWALRVYAALIDRYPHWSGDTLALRVIEALAYTSAALNDVAVRRQVCEPLGRGELDEALAALPEGSVTGAREGLRLLAALGPAALALLDIGPADTRGEGELIETRCAGVFLLIRAISDLKLPRLAESMGYPAGEAIERPGDFVIPLLLRLAGAGVVDEGRIDPALAWLTRGNSCDLEALRGVWSAVPHDAHRRFRKALLSVLFGRRLVTGDRLHIYVVRSEEGGPALVGGDGRGLLWPLGDVWNDSGRRIVQIGRWISTWTQVFGSAPAAVFIDESLADGVETERLDGVRLMPVADAEGAGAQVDAEDVTAHHSGRRALLAALSALNEGRLGVPAADLSLVLLAITVVRAWARWLPRFSQSSVAHLLENFIRRTGTLYVDASTIVVELEPAPLDVVIEMAGYTGELEQVNWLGGRNVKFQVRR